MNDIGDFFAWIGLGAIIICVVIGISLVMRTLDSAPHDRIKSGLPIVIKEQAYTCKEWKP